MSFNFYENRAGRHECVLIGSTFISHAAFDTIKIPLLKRVTDRVLHGGRRRNHPPLVPQPRSPSYASPTKTPSPFVHSSSSW
ncbi:unnamed protein product [Lupinus luteus]|uniref:Uncharacterized protein n=1 Tax=Lupinus luteus TaxID=3873 RepID=A0AAV1X6W8_LUPLU